MTYWKLIVCAALAYGAGISAVSAQQLNAQQVQLIKDTAAAVCNTVREAKGQKSDVQLQGDVKAQLSGLAGKIVDAGISGKASLTREDFEGLSREATAAALEGDRGCRERVFNKMFDKLSLAAPNETQTITATYVVCVGEYARRCPQNSVYLYCGSSVGDWARRECQSFSETRLDDVPGNKCGYYTAQVTCTKSASR